MITSEDVGREVRFVYTTSNGSGYDFLLGTVRSVCDVEGWAAVDEYGVNRNGAPNVMYAAVEHLVPTDNPQSPAA